jgi:TonB family protein
MPVDLRLGRIGRIGARHWLAALAAAASLHALAIFCFDGWLTSGWLGTDGESLRVGARAESLRISLVLASGGSQKSSLDRTGTVVPSVSVPPPRQRAHPAPEALAPTASIETISRASSSSAASETEATLPLSPASARTRGPGEHLEPESREAADLTASRGPGGEIGIGPDLAEAARGTGRGAESELHSSVGAGAGSARAAAGSNLDDYFSALYERVDQLHEYPRRARRDQIEGTVLLAIRIDRQGRIASCEVRESSGSTLLDRQAERTIRHAAPFGEVPPSVSDASLDFDFPLEYKLR